MLAGPVPKGRKNQPEVFNFTLLTLAKLQCVGEETYKQSKQPESAAVELLQQVTFPFPDTTASCKYSYKYLG